MEAKNSRFFKFMIPGFHQKLNLPPAFCEELKEEKSKRAVIKSRRGTWKVSVSRNPDDGLICFEYGWSLFVHQHGLNIGDFVLFEHTGDLHFNVFVFDPSSCEKEFLAGVKNEDEQGPDPVNAEYHSRRNSETTFSRKKNTGNNPREPAKKKSFTRLPKSQNPHFSIVMKPYHASKWGKPSIPAELSRSNNIWQMEGVTLRDPSRKTWHVNLNVAKTGKFQCRMAKGWHDFYVSNKLKDGDVCFFDLNPSSERGTTASMDVHISRAPL